MKKIKLFLESEQGKDIMVVLVVVLVGLGSFELGRLSKESGSQGIKIEYPSQNNVEQANALSSIISPEKTTTRDNSATKKFFASSKGTKYYPVGCLAGNIIKQENRVYFATGEEAQKAGYELSSSCR